MAENEIKCVFCNDIVGGAHKCIKCNKAAHLICGTGVGEEKYGQGLICFVCEPKNPIAKKGMIYN